MLMPRIASLLIAIASALPLFVLLKMGFADTEVAVAAKPGTVFYESLIMLMVVSMFCTTAGVFIGLGGFIASFGFEVRSPGAFWPKESRFGRLVGKLTAETHSFCGASALCGFMLFFALLATATTVSLVFMILFVDGAFSIEGLLLLLEFLGTLALAVGILAILSFSFRAHPRFGLAVVAAVVAAIIAGFVLYGPEAKTPSLEEFVPVLSVIALGGIIGVAGLRLVRFIKKFRIYGNVCPVRAHGAQEEHPLPQ